MKYLFSAVAFVSLASPAFAGDEPATIPNIVITATRAPTDASKIASAVTVITREEIEQKNRPSVVELLRDVPGVVVAANGGHGQTSSLFMRGTNSDHVLVLVDGVPVNDPSGPKDAFDFSNISTDNVERIEILRGPQSTLYGTQAIGGVINIISKTGRGAPKQTAFVEYGRYNTTKAGVGSSGEIGRTSYSLTASQLNTGGISALDTRYGGYERDGSNVSTLAANISQSVSERFKAKFNARYSRVDSELDGYDSFFNFVDTPLPRNDMRQFNGRVAGELRSSDGRWVQELGVGALNINRSASEVTYDHYIGNHDVIDWVHHYSLSKDHVLTGGLESWYESFRDLGRLAQRSTSNKAAFVNDQWSWESFFASAGARVDDHQTFGKAFTWKIAPGYRIAATGTVLKFTYGTGFKAPSLYQLFDPTSGNTALRPEKSKGYDGGFEQALWGDRVTFGASWFHNAIRNGFDFMPTYPYQSINKGKLRTQGVESFVHLRLSPEWSLNATHTYTLADDALADRALLRRPKHQATAGGEWQFSGEGSAGFSMRYFANRQDYDLTSNVATLKGFTTFDLFADYRLSPQATVYSRLDNLFDRRYEEVYGYGMPGRALTVGVKAEF